SLERADADERRNLVGAAGGLGDRAVKRGERALLRAQKGRLLEAREQAHLAEHDEAAAAGALNHVRPRGGADKERDDHGARHWSLSRRESRRASISACGYIFPLQSCLRPTAEPAQYRHDS